MKRHSLYQSRVFIQKPFVPFRGGGKMQVIESLLHLDKPGAHKQTHEVLNIMMFPAKLFQLIVGKPP